MKRMTCLDPLMEDHSPVQEHDELLQNGMLSTSLAPESNPLREDLILQHLRSQLRLVSRVLSIERERVAQLAETWGHRTFAQFLRERMSREAQLQEQLGPLQSR